MSGEVRVFLLPRHVESACLPGSVTVVLDVLRASTTILTALSHGAAGVLPCADVQTAASRAASSPGRVLTGGERQGVKIPGFDLDNSPAAYTGDRVAGKSIAFTTTNGTAALLACRGADRILVASLVNRSAAADELARDGRPVRLICAGTDGVPTSEDVLAAGAIIAALEERVGPSPVPDDLAVMAKDFWTVHSASPADLLAALRQSQGGRNLVSLGLEADIRRAAEVDSLDLVAEYFPHAGRIEPVPRTPVPLPYARH